MGTRGWQHVTQKQLGEMGAKARKPTKFRNVKTTIDGQTFDSRKEADYWVLLRAREQAGQIRDLQRQVRFALHTVRLPIYDGKAGTQLIELAQYVADFTYYEDEIFHVVDVKGHRTREYLLKRKWMEAEHNLIIDEV